MMIGASASEVGGSGVIWGWVFGTGVSIMEKKSYNQGKILVSNHIELLGLNLSNEADRNEIREERVILNLDINPNKCKMSFTCC